MLYLKGEGIRCHLDLKNVGRGGGPTHILKRNNMYYIYHENFFLQGITLLRSGRGFGLTDVTDKTKTKKVQ